MSQDPPELKPEDIKVYYDKDEIKSIFRDALTVANRVSKQVDLEGGSDRGDENVQIARTDLEKIITGLSVALRLMRKPDVNISKISRTSTFTRKLDDHAPDDISDLFDFFGDPSPSEGGD
jgi:hypothetical protein